MCESTHIEMATEKMLLMSNALHPQSGKELPGLQKLNNFLEGGTLAGVCVSPQFLLDNGNYPFCAVGVCIMNETY